MYDIRVLMPVGLFGGPVGLFGIRVGLFGHPVVPVRLCVRLSICGDLFLLKGQKESDGFEIILPWVMG